MCIRDRIYTGSHNKVCIICSEHGEFFQKATNHLTGNGCKKCAYKYSHGKYRLTSFETFLSQGPNSIILVLKNGSEVWSMAK